MKNGFTFKGRHTSEFGVTVATQSRPISSDTKTQTYEAALCDGEYDFSGANLYGREFYNTRVFKYNIKVIEDDLRDLQRKLGKITRWLRGEGELVFDDTPNVKWKAKIIDLVDYKPQHGHSTVLSVSFKAEPFGASLFNVLDGPILDSDIFLDDDIPLDMSEYFVFEFESNGTSAVYNIGDMPVRPIIIIENAAAAVTLTCNDTELTVPGACVIDCEKQIVLSSGGKSLMQSVTGNFFELAPGANMLTLSAAAKVTVSYEPKYMYDDNFDEVDLGD